MKAGYKQTEVGFLPEDWTNTVLGEVAASVTSGRSKVQVGQGVYPVHGSTGIIGFTRKGDYSGDAILVARVGANAGRLNLVSGEYGVTDNTILLRLRSDACLQFYFHQLERKRLNTLVFGSGQPLITGTQLKALEIPTPRLSEQRAIAGALGDVDGLLGGLERLIAKKRDLKQAAMQQLLTGQTRLPGFSGKWEERRVCDMGDVLAGKALDVHGTGRLRPYLRTKNVLDGRIDTDDVLEMPMTDAEFQRFRINRGDVLLNEGQSLDLVGRCSGYRDELSVPCAMQNQLLRFRAGPTTSPSFAEHLFRRCQHNGVFASIATQTTSVAHLGSSRFASLALLWPIEFDEQSAIATVLSDMDAELTALEQRRDKTRLLKQGMMQELLTGRTRLV